MLSVTTSLLASAHGFALQGSVGANEMMCAATQQPRSLAPPLMSSEPLFSAETSRRAVLAALLGAGVGAGAMPATAGYVTSLGLETTKPTDADVDDELLASRAIQGSLNSLKKYKATAASLKGAFFKDTTMQLIPTIRKEFDFSKLRDDLNVVTTVFDDTTQLTVDRLSRRYTPLPHVPPQGPTGQMPFEAYALVPSHMLRLRSCRFASSQHPVRPDRARERLAPQEGGDEPHGEEDRSR